MRNDDLLTELTRQPFNAQVEIQGEDDVLGTVAFVATGVTYDAHSNTITIHGS